MADVNTQWGGDEKYPRVAERLGFKSRPRQPPLRQTTSLLKNLLTAKATQSQAGLLLGAKASGSTQVLVGFLACTGIHTHTHTHTHIIIIIIQACFRMSPEIPCPAPFWVVTAKCHLHAAKDSCLWASPQSSAQHWAGTERMGEHPALPPGLRRWVARFPFLH